MLEAATQQPKRKISPEKHREYRLRAVVRHPEKIRARIITGNAICAGELVRQPCEKCSAEPAQAHHDDYSRPMEVRWLCRPCHAEHHRVERTHCRRGHELAGHNLIIWGKQSKRKCRTCHNACQRKTDQRRRASK